MAKKVSIIIPVFNGEKFLPETIDSALKQDYSNFEIIIIDDGSTDQTKKIVDRYKKNHRNIKYIYQQNKGLGGARNTGIRNSDAPLFANLDADDIYHPSFLSKTVKKLIKTNADAVAPNCQYFYKNKTIKTKTFFDQNRTSSNINLENMLKGNKIASTALIKKKSAIEIGYYRRMNHLEDYDFWLRMLLMNKKIVTIKEPLFNYRIHQSSMSANSLGMAKAEIKTFTGIKKKLPTKRLQEIADKRLSDALVSAGRYRQALKTNLSLKTCLLFTVSLLSKKLAGRIIKKKRSLKDPKVKILK